MPNMVEFKVDITAGDDHELKLRTLVPEGVEGLYFMGAAKGATVGINKVGEGLTGLINPDDPDPVLRMTKAALGD